MENNKILGKYMSLLINICLLAFVGLVFFSCNKDDEPIGPEGPDTRLEGKDLVLVLHDNPKTKAAYTEEELAELSYDPYKEEFYTTSQTVKNVIWLQQRPEKVEIFKEGTDELVFLLETFTRDDRPDLASYKEGYGYSGKWTTSIENLGVEIDQSATYQLKVTYYDTGINGFKTPSVRETTFTIHHYDDGSGGIDLSESLVGFWRFNDPTNLGRATRGNDLVIGGDAEVSAVEGVNAGDGASQIGLGSWYEVNHGMSATGGSNVNAYTLIFDINVPGSSAGNYVNLLQNLTDNSADGAVYIHPNLGFWFNGGPGGHEAGTIVADTWHRIVISVDAPTITFFVDGIEIYTADIATVDGTFSLDPSKFLLFADNGGEDYPIKISELMLFNTAFLGSQIQTLPAVGTPAVDDISTSLVGRWKFDNAANLLEAHLGKNLSLGGAASQSFVNGVNEEDGAAHLTIGTWYNVDHGMAPSGGSNINDYTMIWDIKVSEADLGKYICLLQYNTANDSDGAVYIHPNAGFWFNGGPGGHAPGTIKADTWHRIVLSVSAPEVVFYVDGVEIYKNESLAVADAQFSLDPTKFIILGENSSNDGNGEDNPISISDFMLFNKAMTSDQIVKLPLIGKSVF